MSRWVWLVGVLLLCVIGGAATLGYYMTKSSSASSAPEPLGGSADQGSTLAITTKATASTTSTIKHVTPTNTVAKRYPEDDGYFMEYPPTPVPAPAPSPSGFIIARHRNMQKRLKL